MGINNKLTVSKIQLKKQIKETIGRNKLTMEITVRTESIDAFKYRKHKGVRNWLLKIYD